MARINPLEFNMSISRNIYEGRSSNYLIATAQKIATYLIIPLSLVVFFEAVVKNIIVFNLMNLGIAVINAVHDAIIPEKKPEAPVEDPPAAAPPAAVQQPIANQPNPAEPAPNIQPPPPPPVVAKTSSLAKVAKYGLAAIATSITAYSIYSGWTYFSITPTAVIP